VIRGQALAVWLARTHPMLLQKVAAQMPRRLGDDGLVDFDFSSIGEDLAPLSSVSSAVDNADWLASFTPTLVDVTSDIPQTIDQVQQSSAINWSSVFSNAASAAAPAQQSSSVGTFLSTPDGLSALAKAAGSYFQAQASASQAQTQQAILQAQTARAAAGQNPASIGYVTNPATGQQVPVLNTGRGLVPVTQPVLAGLLPSGLAQVFGQYGIYILLGIGVLLLFSMGGTRDK